MKEKIRMRLQELRKEEKESPTALGFAAERSVEMIKAYCNLEEAPEALMGVGIALAGRLLEGGGTATPSAKAKTIREGDVSVTFAEGEVERKEREMLEGFQVELDRFRRAGW